ncbi:DNA-3-methyladenine glycosylase [Schinkia azotoformans]|uniref:DNA-3-methyladenine glycosylase family protein n=1 Tax=Schinkia azotoformans TaxID=1454 RepID=UPI002E1F4422|nr:DNA-3-methyladenine glycosylase [Schinkia azotoformans]
MWQEVIEIEGPYQFDRVIERHAIDPLNQVDLQKRLIKVPILIEEKNQYIVEVTGLGTVNKPVFKLTGNNSKQKEAQIKRISEIFQWNTPLKQVNRHFQQTDLRDLFQEHFGTPLVLDFDPFSCLVKCIIHQQLNLSFSHTLTERFVKTFGNEIDGVWFYPNPEIVANITVEQLRDMQFSSRKGEYVIGIGIAVAGRDLEFEALARKSEEEIFNELIKIRGIGAWTIQNFLLFALGRPNLFPATDIGIQNALKKLYRLDRKPTLEEIEQYKHRWEPYLSYAALYLWRSIE